MSSLFIMLFAVCTFILSAVASPMPTELFNSSLAKRVTHTGRGTWYYPGLGNCGETDDSSSMVVAMAKSFYDANNGGNCNQMLTISANGKSVQAKLRDSCESCGYYDLDMSPAVFSELASLDVGEISTISWNFEAR